MSRLAVLRPLHGRRLDPRPPTDSMGAVTGFLKMFIKMGTHLAPKVAGSGVIPTITWTAGVTDSTGKAIPWPYRIRIMLGAISSGSFGEAPTWKQATDLGFAGTLPLDVAVQGWMLTPNVGNTELIPPGQYQFPIPQPLLPPFQYKMPNEISKAWDVRAFLYARSTTPDGKPAPTPTDWVMIGQMFHPSAVQAVFIEFKQGEDNG